MFQNSASPSEYKMKSLFIRNHQTSYKNELGIHICYLEGPLGYTNGKK